MIPLAFAQPLILLGLLSLPVLWWLLRLIPPRPRRVNLGSEKLLLDILPKEETPAQAPWWLTLLRLALAALVILAAAGPLWNPPSTATSGRAPLALIIDDGFPAAGTWDTRVRTAEELITRAEANNRGVALIALSEPTRDISLETPGAARVRLHQMEPKPHAVARSQALPALGRFLGAAPEAEIVWLSDGVDLGDAKQFIDGLARLAGDRALTVIEGGILPARALTAADNAAGALTLKVLRAAASGALTGSVRVLDLKGLPLGDANFAFEDGARETEAEVRLPVEIRNEIARIEIVGERSAGAVQLLDNRWRRRTVGVISGATADTAQPLLAATFYLSRALAPFADVRLADRGSPAQAIGELLDQRLPMLILADVGTVVGAARTRLDQWIDQGGVLVRFAGPRLAAGDDDLVPVRLRRGGRILGGSLSWEQPQQLSAFPGSGPFAGMTVPDDVTVNRQVLAEPDARLTDRTWATLADGTPLVTAQRYGKGLIILFHVTADTRWSNLPLSGAFVEMLRRVVALAGAGASDVNAQRPRGEVAAVPPTRVLDGYGAFVPPPPTARPIPENFTSRADAEHPPGFYGPPEGLIAVNALAASDRLVPLDTSSLSAHRETYRTAEPVDLRGPTFIAALVLLAVDAVVVLWLIGGLGQLLRLRRPATTALALALAGTLLAAMHLPASAQQRNNNDSDARSDDMAILSTDKTRLAYVVTGDAEVDEISNAGLMGLTLFLAQRTALEAGDPVGLDPARDELSFYPLIYWPIARSAQRPSPQVLQRIDAYMKQGGTVLFDTRDALETPPGGTDTSGPGMLALREILGSLDIPELEPVPRDHVLTKTFYLLSEFPGRYSGGRMWVEALPQNQEQDASRPARAGDGVSSILITSNDLAGAWALRPDGQAMLPMQSGDPRFREFAFRAGVNIVMYTLTGNYKADQVHVPALLERLGQ